MSSFRMLENEKDAAGTALTDQQEKMLSFASTISGSVSVVSSLMILYIILKSRSWGESKKTTKLTPYTRLLFGLSFFDIIQSVTQAMQPYLVPVETSTRVWASGTDATCSFAGSMMQLGSGAALFNAFLSFYFMLSVRYAMTPSQFEGYFEPYCHGVAIGYPLTTACIGLALDMFGELEGSIGCWVDQVPRGCRSNHQICRGEAIGWIFGGFPLVFSFLSIAINNVVVFVQTRRLLQTYQECIDETESISVTTIPHREQRSIKMPADFEGNCEDIGMEFGEYGKWKTGGKSPEEEREEKIKIVKVEMIRLRGMASQALLYVGTFFLTYGWIFASQLVDSQGYTDKAKIFWPLLFPGSILFPLQGFMNLFVFARPSYIGARLEYPLESRIWCLRRAWFGPRISPTKGNDEVAE